jgi:N-acetylmuramoyl-L-alanine amidase
MTRTITRALAAALAAGLLAQAVAAQNDPKRVEPSATLGVVYTDGRGTEDLPLYRLEEESEELFVSAYDLARIFRATRFWNPSARKLNLRIENKSFLFTVDTRVVVAEESPVLLRVPVRYANGSVMVPLEFISEVLPRGTLGRVELDEPRLVLTIGSPEYNVTGVAFEEDEEESRAVLTLSEELLYHVDAETPGLLRLKVYGGKVNTLLIGATAGRGLFNRVRAEQTEHDAFLFFDVRRSAERFRVEFLEADAAAQVPNRLVIHLERGEQPEIPGVELAGRRMTEILDAAGAGEGGAIVRVAIDPGHGGIDNGRVGPSGLLEKDVNLHLAVMLREILAGEYGMEVLLTRTTDELVPLSRRAELANEWSADLFISIHCNGWFHPDAGGFETFFLSPARTEEDTRLAMEENSSLQFEGKGIGPEDQSDLGFILWDMVQNEFISESSGLAELVQRELDKAVDIRNRGVKQAGLIVLKGCRMPAILVETAFLSNPDEEKLLADARFRQSLVRGIAEGIGRFRSRFAGAGGGSR